jgi:phenylalanyl-tRNA synthetase alpha chain
MSGSNDLDALLREAEQAVASAGSTQALTEVRARFLGRKGQVSELLRGIGELAPEARGRAGQAANEAKRRIEEWVDARRAELEQSATDTALRQRAIDVTLPGAQPPAGRLHPLTHVTRDMVEFFASLGFSVETAQRWRPTGTTSRR